MFEEVIEKVKQGKRLGNYCQLVISDNYYLIFDLRCGLLALWSGDRGFDKDGFKGNLISVIGFSGDISDCGKLVKIYNLIYENSKTTKDSKICKGSLST